MSTTTTDIVENYTVEQQSYSRQSTTTLVTAVTPSRTIATVQTKSQNQVSKDRINPNSSCIWVLVLSIHMIIAYVLLKESANAANLVKTAVSTANPGNTVATIASSTAHVNLVGANISIVYPVYVWLPIMIISLIFFWKLTERKN